MNHSPNKKSNMDIALYARVDGCDGEIGRVEDMILSTMARKAIILVVRAAKSPNALRMVPEKYVTGAVHDLVTLSMDSEKFHEMREFIKSDYLSPDLFLRLAKQEQDALPVPPAGWNVEYEAVPEGSVVLRRHCAVLATDGLVGTVDEYLLERRTGRVTHLIMIEGPLWGKREIHIPVRLVERFDDDGAHLAIDKQAVELLPLIGQA